MHTTQARTEKRSFMRPINRFLERWIPSALTFAIILTLIVAILAMTLAQQSPVAVIKGWGDGLAGLLAFMTQMRLVLLLGYMLANTRPVRKLLRRAALVPKSAGSAYVFVFVVAAIASLFTWGLGLVVGTLLVREIAVQARERGTMKVHFPLLVASGYSGFVIWHMGYSGSGPLTAATTRFSNCPRTLVLRTTMRLTTLLRRRPTASMLRAS